MAGEKALHPYVFGIGLRPSQLSTQGANEYGHEKESGQEEGRQEKGRKECLNGKEKDRQKEDR
jgi:hypothetical protein